MSSGRALNRARPGRGFGRDKRSAPGPPTVLVRAPSLRSSCGCVPRWLCGGCGVGFGIRGFGAGVGSTSASASARARARLRARARWRERRPDVELPTLPHGVTEPRDTGPLTPCDHDDLGHHEASRAFSSLVGARNDNCARLLLAYDPVMEGHRRRASKPRVSPRDRGTHRLRCLDPARRA